MKKPEHTTNLMPVNGEDSVGMVPEKRLIKSRPPQHIIDKMNRAIIAAAKTGKTPGELENDIYREMFE